MAPPLSEMAGYAMFSIYRMRIVATCALVAGPWGLRVVVVVPPMIPCSTHQAMAWCVEQGIIGGTTTTTLSPQGPATRAQVATILMRYIENIA